MGVCTYRHLGVWECMGLFKVWVCVNVSLWVRRSMAVCVRVGVCGCVKVMGAWLSWRVGMWVRVRGCACTWVCRRMGKLECVCMCGCDGCVGMVV